MDLAAGELRGEVKLGATASFRLGKLEVRPATRQLLLRANSLTVEPRVMQVLVVLGQAAGEVVTRDELIMRCWGGRIVGENAIHRALSRVRELGAGFAQGAFAVETIAKVGYRLSPASDEPIADESPVRRRVGRRLLPVLGIAAVIATIVALTAFQRKPAATASLSVEIAPASASVAPDLARELSAGLSGQDAGIRIAPASEGSSQLVLAVSRTSGGGAVASIATSGGDLLWSASASKPDGATLTPAIAARAGEQLVCVRDLVDDNARVRPRPLQLAFAACDRMDDIGSDAPIGALKALAAERPQSASAWAYLAIAETYRAKQVRALDPPHLGKAFQSRADYDIAQAARLQPDNATLFAARAAAREPDWKSSIDFEERGLAAHPQSALLLTVHSMSLQSVGRMGEAIQAARAAVAADPFSVAAETQLIFVLAHGNFLDQARSELRRADMIWPGSPPLHILKDALVYRYGNTRELNFSGDTAEQMSGASVSWREVARQFLKARATNSPADIDQAIATSRSAWLRSRRGSALYVQTLGQFGRIDEAYALMADPAALPPLKEMPEILFRAHMAGFRRDRRFIQLAARLGLLDYWMSTGNWPDFCFDPGLPYDCRGEARKLRKQS